MMYTPNNRTPVKRNSIFSSGGGGGGNNSGRRPSSNRLFPKKTARGRFLEGVWYCDCEPRLPGNHFQTKKAGVNNGRWFYTCQKPQAEQCGFFLWQDDAKVREERVVLVGKRSEDSPMKSTPTHTPRATGLPTPRTSERAWPSLTSGQRGIPDPLATPTKKGGSLTQQPSSSSKGLFTDDDDSFGWDEDLEEQVGKLTQQEPVPTPRLPPPETPRKVPRTDTLTSPGKRKLADMEGDGEGGYSSIKTEGSGSSFPYTPSTSTAPPRQPDFSSLYTPQTDSLETTSSVGQATPTPARFSSQDPFTQGNSAQNSSYPQTSPSKSSSSPCPLAKQSLTLLDAHKISLTQPAKDDLLSLLDRNDLKMQGISRGRDITRVALQKKEENNKELMSERDTARAALQKEEEKNRELMGRIEALETQRELDKATISGLMMERRKNG